MFCLMLVFLFQYFVYTGSQHFPESKLGAVHRDDELA